MLGNKTVFVTGSSRGIGKAIAALFAVEGYNVAIMCSSSKRELEETEKELKVYNPNILALMGDLAEYKTARNAVEQIERVFGCIDVLVNNAGISYVGLFNTMRPSEWKRVIDTNLNSMLNCTHAAVQNMIRTHRGNIINISSMWGELGASCEAVYSATKGAVNSFTKSMAKELAPSNIRVNAISCGVIETKMNSFLSPSEKMALREEIPLGRFGTPDEVAKLALYLAESDSAYITGQIISIDGGMS
ncbi:MAG: 3-oxoacyl-ACP reductase FabG [Clostridia bacterium]|nr:3-oxoacyl-ACP reductase FabG [Clostridia bacterium]